MESANALAYRLNDNLLMWTADTFLMGPLGMNHSQSERLARATEMLERSPRGVGQQTLRQAYFFMVHRFLDAGMREQMEATMERHQLLADQTKQPNVEGLAAGNRAIVAILDGRLEEAVDIAEELRARSEVTGVSEYGRLMAFGASGRALAIVGC